MKKLGLILGILVLAGLGWYFFLKPSDYTVTFSAKANTGTVNQTLKLWNLSLEGKPQLTQESLGELLQVYQVGDSIHDYRWSIIKQNDSTVKVRLRATDELHSLSNRWQVLTGGSDFAKRAKKVGEEFLLVLTTHLEKIDISIEGEAETPETYYAYMPMKSLQMGKAGGMMRNFNFITGMMLRNGVEQKGSPFIEILDWDQKTDSIHYNFCFPIIRSENLPQHPDIKYGKRYAKKAIKAIYNGNYITSDRAWYALQEYAEANGIDIELTPLEVYFNNPQMGGNEEDWKTEVFMPIAE